MSFPSKITAFLAALELVYGDNTVDGLTGLDVQPVEEAEVTWSPLMERRLIQAGEFQGAGTVNVGERLDLSFKYELTPSDLTPDGLTVPAQHTALMSSGARFDFFDDGLITGFDTGVFFSFAIAPGPFNMGIVPGPAGLWPGSVRVYDRPVDGAPSAEVFVDDGLGFLFGSNGGTGTVDYVTGAISVTLNGAGPFPADGTTFLVDYADAWQLPAPLDMGIRCTRGPGPYDIQLPSGYFPVQPNSLVFEVRDSGGFPVEVFTEFGGVLNGTSGGGGSFDPISGLISGLNIGVPVDATFSFHLTILTIQTPGPYRMRYNWTAFNHQSFGGRFLLLGASGSTAYEMSGKGGRFAPTITAAVQKRIMLNMSGGVVDPEVSKLDTIPEWASFNPDLPVVASSAAVVLTLRRDMRGLGDPTVYNGTLMDVELRPNFREDRGEAQGGVPGGFDEVLLTRQQEEFDVEIKLLDLDEFDWREAYQKSVPVELDITWADPCSAGRTITARAVGSIDNEGLDWNFDRNGRAALKIKCVVMWRSDVDSFGSQAPHGTNPVGRGIEIEWSFDPTVDPVFTLLPLP